MSLYAAIATLKKRLARASTERDGWYAAGNQGEYLAACCTVDTLQLQLERLEAAARASAKSSS
jgi:hypothetical protein